MVLLHLKSDTLKSPLDFKLEQNQQYPRTFTLSHNWEGGENYTLSIDSAAISNIYGIASDNLEQSFKVRNIDEYGNVKFNLNQPGNYGELYMINNSGEIIRKKSFKPEDKTLDFTLVLPGKYYFYLYFDLNQNGEWDTGEYLLHQQPEPIRYFPKVVDVKAYRDYEEDWNTEELPLWKQKPQELIGKEDKKGRR